MAPDAGTDVTRGYDALERWLADGAASPLPPGVDPAAAEMARALARSAQAVAPDPGFAEALLNRLAAGVGTPEPDGPPGRAGTGHAEDGAP
ncbi:hypothetical protein DCC79_09435, partial [bacterium]